MFLIFSIIALALPLVTAGITVLAIKRMPLLNRLKKAVSGEGLKLIGTSTLFTSKQHVRCAAGDQVITFSWGTLNASPVLECVIPVPPYPSIFAPFIISSGYKQFLTKSTFRTLQTAHQNSASYDENWHLDVISTLLTTPPMTGDSNLTNLFTILSAKEDELNKMLSPQVQIKLRQLRGLFRNDQLLIFCENNIIHIAKPSGYKNSEQAMSNFVTIAIDLVIALFNQTGNSLQLGNRTKRKLTAGPSSSSHASNHRAHGDPHLKSYRNRQLQVTSPATSGEFKLIETSHSAKKEKHCQICGDLILNKYVSCTACETQYHKDCWNYNGQCATFGCPSTTFYNHE